ncbi:MAG TPA: xanthine dehydrogenase family protein subunit M [Phnomibacter sp.]|nr:xanthine dehydrogenase family protein subunit M [Phnomibacter sp.]
MIPNAFTYQRPANLAEALQALNHSGGKLLAGGHSLLPAMKLRLNQPETVIDISRIEELKGICEQDGEIVIGAGTTHAAIEHNPLIQEKLSFFAQGAHWIGDAQVRNHGTIGGSLAHADPSADWGAMILAAEATIEIAAPTGIRRVQANDFFMGMFTTALQEDEIITAIRVSIPGQGYTSTYQKFAQPASRFAIVGCAALRLPNGITRIALTGVADMPFRDAGAEAAVSGNPLNAETIQAAARAAAEGVEVMGDQNASPAYRKHLAKVYVQRALEAIS